MRNLSDRLLAATYAQDSAEVFVPIVKLKSVHTLRSLRLQSGGTFHALERDTGVVR